jgi:microsomal dipeptidase-like Zn-dependent dipeptidase
MVEAVGKKSAWDMVALGTDYDGIITHIDFYKDAASLQEFKDDLLDFLVFYNYQNELWFGYSAEQLLEKFFCLNAYNFLKKHF